MLELTVQSGIATALSDPGKPWQNGADESFTGKLRDECLSLEWFWSHREATDVIESWRIKDFYAGSNALRSRKV